MNAENAIDRGAFARQYREAYPKLYLIAAAIVGDRSHAEDIVQEAAVIALSKLDDFTPGSNFVAWLSEIVRRCAKTHARKTRNRATYPTDPVSLDRMRDSQASDSSLLEISGEQGKIPEIQMEFDDDVVHALNSLNDTARCCLLLRVVLQLTYVEIAEIVQIPKGTAMSHVHRGKAILFQRLKDKHHPHVIDSKKDS